MAEVMLKDIKKEPYENWNYYKYEDYNRCPYCNGRIYLKGSVNEFQIFSCLKCGQEFVLNTITEEIEFIVY